MLRHVVSFIVFTLFGCLEAIAETPVVQENVSVVLPLECSFEGDTSLETIVLVKSDFSWVVLGADRITKIEEISDGFAFRLGAETQNLGLIQSIKGDLWSVRILTEEKEGITEGTCRDKTKLVELMAAPINASLNSRLNSALLDIEQLNKQIEMLGKSLEDQKLTSAQELSEALAEASSKLEDQKSASARKLSEASSEASKRLEELRARKDKEIGEMRTSLAQKGLSSSAAEAKLLQKEQELRDERSRREAAEDMIKGWKNFIEATVYKNLLQINAFRDGFGYTPDDTDLSQYRFDGVVDPNCLKTFLVPRGYIGAFCIENLKGNLRPKG